MSVLTGAGYLQEHERGNCMMKLGKKGGRSKVGQPGENGMIRKKREVKNKKY